jgi:hypothetical protein
VQTFPGSIRSISTTPTLRPTRYRMALRGLGSCGQHLNALRQFTKKAYAVEVSAEIEYYAPRALFQLVDLRREVSQWHRGGL